MKTRPTFVLSAHQPVCALGLAIRRSWLSTRSDGHPSLSLDQNSLVSPDGKTLAALSRSSRAFLCPARAVAHGGLPTPAKHRAPHRRRLVLCRRDAAETRAPPFSPLSFCCPCALSPARPRRQTQKQGPAAGAWPSMRGRGGRRGQILHRSHVPLAVSAPPSNDLTVGSKLLSLPLAGLGSSSRCPSWCASGSRGTGAAQRRRSLPASPKATGEFLYPLF